MAVLHVRRHPKLLAFLASLGLLLSASAPAQFAPPYVNAGYLNGAYMPFQPFQMPQISPFIGTPYYESSLYASLVEQRFTGQNHFPLMSYDEALPVLVANRLNWNGASAFGLAGSYMPPIGLNAVNNSLTYSRIAR